MAKLHLSNKKRSNKIEESRHRSFCLINVGTEVTLVLAVEGPAAVCCMENSAVIVLLVRSI
jgi:hypothetical protein